MARRATRKEEEDDGNQQYSLPRTYEAKYWSKGELIVAGVDEAGRGPLAGPVVAAACIVPKDVCFYGVDDSKKVKLQDRDRLFDEITSHPRVHFAICEVSHEEIDKVNILQASMRAMERAVASLQATPHHVFVDGPYAPPGIGGETQTCEAVVKGDSKVFSIACASIIAKVARDRIMEKLDSEFPGYGLAQHKGYPTASHRAALVKLGPSPVHRLSYAPVRKAMGLPPLEKKKPVKKKGNETKKTKTPVKGNTLSTLEPLAKRRRGPNSTAAKARKPSEQTLAMSSSTLPRRITRSSARLLAISRNDQSS